MNTSINTAPAGRAAGLKSLVSGIDQTVPLFFFVVLCVVANKALAVTANWLIDIGYLWPALALVAAACLAGANVSYRDVPRAISILLRTTLAFAVFYIVTSRFHLPADVVGDAVNAGILVNTIWIPAAIAGIIGFVRPSFALLPLLYMYWQKQSLTAIFGIPITAADYITIVDTCGLVVIGCIALRWYRKLQRASPAFNTGFDAGQHPVAGNLALLEALFLAAIALHFGNYFYGAVGKMALGENPLHWIYGNQTEYLILTSREAGVNPLSFSDGVIKAGYEMFAPASWLFNLATVTGQFICLFTIIRPRWAMWTTVFFDLMHLGIFVFTGIFFWKFILLNLAIVFGLKQVISRKIPNAFALMLMVLVVMSPRLFNITYFYWLDTPAMNAVHLIAIDKSGREYRVPPGSFLSMSATLNQQRIINPRNGPFPTWTWGTTESLDEMYKGQRCELQRITPDMPANKFYTTRKRITHAVQTYHRFLMSAVDDNGHLEYDIYPHHMFSMPWDFTAYRQLDKRQIASYRYSIEALCLGYENSQFTRKVIWQDAFGIVLDQ